MTATGTPFKRLCDTGPARTVNYQSSFAGGVPMSQSQEPGKDTYPHGRGYGHDYMRGGEVLGGYGYSERVEYDKRRGELGQKEQQPGPDGVELT